MLYLKRGDKLSFKIFKVYLEVIGAFCVSSLLLLLDTMLLYSSFLNWSNHHCIVKKDSSVCFKKNH